MGVERDRSGHGAHAHPGEEHVWRMPPMDPRASPMPMPGLEDAVPAAEPYLPAWTVDPDTLPAARPREVVDLADGDTLRLEAGFVRRTIQGRTFVMYAFNGQYPGPLLRAPQDAEVVVDFRNRTDWPTAVHWHGVRLDNAFDGVPHLTQEPVETGESFRYRVRFPDAEVYWYHPHHREDITQDLGLYGRPSPGGCLRRATGGESASCRRVAVCKVKRRSATRPGAGASIQRGRKPDAHEALRSARSASCV
jgi:hypothetical protein